MSSSQIYINHTLGMDGSWIRGKVVCNNSRSHSINCTWNMHLQLLIAEWAWYSCAYKGLTQSFVCNYITTKFSTYLCFFWQMPMLTKITWKGRGGCIWSEGSTCVHEPSSKPTNISCHDRKKTIHTNHELNNRLMWETLGYFDLPPIDHARGGHYWNFRNHVR